MRERERDYGRRRERHRDLTPVASKPDRDAGGTADCQHDAAERPRSRQHRNGEAGDEARRPDRCGRKTLHAPIVTVLAGPLAQAARF